MLSSDSDDDGDFDPDDLEFDGNDPEYHVEVIPAREDRADGVLLMCSLG